MRKLNNATCFAMAASLTALTISAYAADPKTPPTDQQMITSAMTAAPAAVAKAATVVAMDPGGKMRTLREGTNGFTCMADNPETPGPDPMCMDKNALEWVHAWVGHKPPATGKVGFMYMLSGGTDASNTDPYATKPTATNNWIETGPHVMVVGAEASFYNLYPKGAKPDTSSPYVMWADTPYQHLMAPVKQAATYGPSEAARMLRALADEIGALARESECGRGQFAGLIWRGQADGAELVRVTGRVTQTVAASAQLELAGLDLYFGLDRKGADPAELVRQIRVAVTAARREFAHAASAVT